MPFISYDVPVNRGMSDAHYLQDVDAALNAAFTTFKPDFVIYNAGTDCMVGDPLGNLNLS